MGSSRREFLRRSGWAGLGLTGFAALPFQGCGSYRLAKYTQTGSVITVAKTEFAEDRFVLVRLYDLPAPIYLVRLAEDDYVALLLLCTHKQCEVQPGSEVLSCPCHGSEFSNTGEVLNPPAEAPLHSFAVTVGEQDLIIELE